MLDLPDHPDVAHAQRTGYPHRPPNPFMTDLACGDCGEPIYEGEDYYDYNGAIYCCECWEIQREEYDKRYIKTA